MDSDTSERVRHRVVLAEDRDDLRRILVMALERQDFDVAAVTDGWAALEELHRHPADALVTDLVMPRMDGFELIRRLRDAPETAGLPVLVLTASGDVEESISSLQRLRLVRVLRKPPLLASLGPTLRDMMLVAAGR